MTSQAAITPVARPAPSVYERAPVDTVVATARIRLRAIVPCFEFKPAYLAVWAPYIVAYQVVNRFPVCEPTTFELTALDRAVPFLPWLLPLYVAYLPYFFWSGARARDREEVNRLFYATHFQLVVSLFFFVLYPVQMPRELFYGADIYNWADRFWRWFDAPNNCFPSLHASNCLLLIQFNWRRPDRKSGV